MATAAKGTFPGRPKKKIEKRKVKFKHQSYRNELDDLKLTCSFITNITEQFHLIFDDDRKQEVDFVGFSSEECGLQAYKRISKKSTVSPSNSKDILQTQLHYDKVKVTTRGSHARESISSPSHVTSSDNYYLEGPNHLSRDDFSSDFLGSAFLKYKDSKLDFHRLSKKARNKDNYEGCSLEEREQRKCASAATLKYLSDIYVTKNHILYGATKSPIKPATFVPPATSMPISCGRSGRESYTDDCATKSLITQTSKQTKQLGSVQGSKKQWKNRGFVLPSKSTRSSRIIKANRKYIDGGNFSVKNSLVGDQSVSGNTNIPHVVDVPECSVTISRIPNLQDVLEKWDAEHVKGTQKVGRISNHRKPLIKEPTFLADESLKITKSSRRHKDGIQAHARRLIKRARFKHPTSSDALVLGKDYVNIVVDNKQKNLIRRATFTAPTSIKRGRISTKTEKFEVVSLKFLASQFGSSLKELEKLMDPVPDKTVIGTTMKTIPRWTIQEFHNLLHGLNTYGSSWPTIARQYDFHPLHRDWLSVRNKAQKCRAMGLLNASFKVESSILLHLKPKRSILSNVTVYTPSQLQALGLQENMPYNIDKTQSCLMGRRRRNGRVGDENSVLQDNLSARDESRIFGTDMDVNRSVDYKDISKEDLYLGLPRMKFYTLLRVRSLKLKHCMKQWSPWEIHNILHGMHYFGVESWKRIESMYRFQRGHGNFAIETRLKSICYKGFIISGKVRSDVLPKLHVVLSEKGKKYFNKRRIPVKLCCLSESQAASLEAKEYERFSRSKEKVERISKKKRRTNNKLDASNNTDDDVTVSPVRRQAYHLFGAKPVWDEASQMDLIVLKPDSEAAPVMQALEDGLQRNKSSRISKSSKHNRRLCSPSLPSKDDVVEDARCNTQVPSRPNKANSVSKEKVTKSTTSKGRGPRIKHVCRRASLVTGRVRATREDRTPHLSALPKGEREKVVADAEKLKENVCGSSSSGSEGDKAPQKLVNPASKKTVSRKRKRNHRCGTCETCLAPPCGECNPCRESKNTQGSSAGKLDACFNSKPCLVPGGPVSQTKRTRKNNAPELHPASRKSSRLQQRKVPLQSVITNPPSSTSDLLSSTYELLQEGLFDQGLLTEEVSTMMSPTTRIKIFENLKNSSNQATVKIDNWKETYDLDLLWKGGGHALIASNLPPPQITCLLCGSNGSSSDDTDKLIHCASCCEPFHRYCADEGYDQQANVTTAMNNGTWICKRCQCCRVCGQPKNLLECRRCRKTYHKDCLGPNYPVKSSSSKIWVCMQCVRCKSCGTSKPGSLPGSLWTHDYTMCERCGGLFDKGNFCPICHKCYNDEDYDTKMIQCAKCKRWIHSKCENLSVEMYTVLSHLPEHVHYNCPDCDGRANEVEESFNKKNPLNAKKAMNVENFRKLLSHLPHPPWKKAMEKEIQSGLEAVTMAIFHNHATYCVLKKSEAGAIETESTHADEVSSKPHDLFAVRFAVHNKRYRSVATFCSDVHRIFASVSNQDEREALEKAFKEEAGSVFPWFNFGTCRIRDEDDVPEDLLPNATLPPLPEHDYAQWQDKDVLVDPGTPNPSPLKSISFGLLTNSTAWSSTCNESEDLRQCLFCNKHGNGKPMGCGRLLYCGQDEWCHVNCALWSAEVYEQHDGSLANVHSAVSRGRMMKCEYCRHAGATVGCNTKDCPKNYHFICGRLAGCDFHEDKKVFCFRHKNNYKKKEVVIEDEFEVERLVCVDNDEMRPNRRWQRGMLIDNVTVAIGSLTIQQLGRLSSASDSKQCLIPSGYRISRLFWSTKSSTHKTVYTIAVNEIQPSIETDMSGFTPHDDHRNLTISHHNEEVASIPEREMQSQTHENYHRSCRTKLTERFHDNKTTSSLGVSATSSSCLEVPVVSSSLLEVSTIPFSSSGVPSISSPPLEVSTVSTSSFEAPATPTSVAPSSTSLGSYTLMASINKSLPQAVTPFPVAVSGGSTGSVITTMSTIKQSKRIHPVASPANPYLNNPVSFSDQLKMSLNEEETTHKPQSDELNTRINPTSSKFGRDFKSDITTCPVDQKKVTLDVASGGKLESVVKIPASSSSTQTSLTTKVSPTVKVVTSQPEMDHAVTTGSDIREVVDPPVTSVTSCLRSAFPSIQNSINHPPPLSLLVGAKHAAHLEEQKIPTNKEVIKTPPLWWKMSYQDRRHPSRLPENNKLEKIPPRRKSRSLDVDPSYEVPASEFPVWRRKTTDYRSGGLKSSFTSTSRACKLTKSRNKYKELDEDEEDVEEGDMKINSSKDKRKKIKCIMKDDSLLMATTSSQTTESSERKTNKISSSKTRSLQQDKMEDRRSKCKFEKKIILGGRSRLRSGRRSRLNINYEDKQPELCLVKLKDDMIEQSLSSNDDSDLSTSRISVEETIQESCKNHDGDEKLNNSNLEDGSSSSVVSEISLPSTHRISDDEDTCDHALSQRRNLRRFALASNDGNNLKEKTQAAEITGDRSQAVVMTQRLSKSSDPHAMSSLTKLESTKLLQKDCPTFDTPKCSRTLITRSRTRRRQSSCNISMLKVLESTPCSEFETHSNKIDEEVEHNNSSMICDDVMSPRRYPRRNTYTCLKSFSGLSPSYALASYAREEKAVDRDDRNKNRKKNKRMEKKNGEIFERNKIQASIFLPTVSLVKVDEDAMVKMEPSNWLKSHPEKHTDQSSSSTMIPSNHLSSDLKIEMQPPCKEKLTESILHQPDVIEVVPVLDDEDSHIVKDLLNKVLDRVSTSSLSQARDLLTSPAPLEASSLRGCNINDLSSSLASLNQSVEVIRGGGEEKFALPRLETLASPIPENPSRSMSQVSDWLMDDIDVVAPPTSIKSSSSCSHDNLYVLAHNFTQKDVALVPPPSLNANLLQIADQSLYSVAECPILNVKEVETILQIPETNLYPQAVNTTMSSDVSSPFLSSPIPLILPNNSTSHHQEPPVVPSNFPINDHLTPLHSSRRTPQILPVSGKGHPHPAPCIPQMNFSQQSSIGVLNPHLLESPTPVNSFINQVHPTALNPLYVTSSLESGDRQRTRNISLNPYSVRVTMAMAGLQSCTSNMMSQGHVAYTPIPQHSGLINHATAWKEQSVDSLLNVENRDREEILQTSINPQSRSSSQQLDPLEDIIKYYSAKNNLTREEMEIVRVIVKNKIKKNKSHTINATNQIENQEKISLKRPPSSGNNSQENKRRKSSCEDPSPIKQMKKDVGALKNKVARLGDDDDFVSPLMKIYRNRQIITQSNDRPMFLSYNILLGKPQMNGKQANLQPPVDNSGPDSKDHSYLMYEIHSDDGYHAKGSNLRDMISQLLTAVEECRSTSKGFNPTVALHSVMTSHAFLGLSHDAVRYLVEQLPGANHCPCYRAKYHKHKKLKAEVRHINPHGCCRAEPFKGRSKPDMFSFLASKHRFPPQYQIDKHQDDDMIQLSNRRVTSMEDLPMAMRFRHLGVFSKQAVGVYRSSIHGRGLYCKRDLESGEMVMEYTGQMIRKELTDKRENYYDSKSIGCYMFRMDDFYVVDATRMGSAARFINHSCDPNCIARIVTVDGKKHIVIFAVRKIRRGEELTYDYKFAIEDESHKLLCNCGAKSCRKFMN